MDNTSCVGCKFLYTEDTGYSNWTVEDTDVKCAKDMNSNLPAEEPDEWLLDDDNWKRTNNSRCDMYSKGVMVTLDVDGEDHPSNFTSDEEAIEAICKHSGR